jgi:hypothetical protein
LALKLDKKRGVYVIAPAGYDKAITFRTAEMALDSDGNLNEPSRSSSKATIRWSTSWVKWKPMKAERKKTLKTNCSVGFPPGDYRAHKI